MLLRRGHGHAGGQAFKQHATGDALDSTHQLAVLGRIGVGTPEHDGQAVLHGIQHGVHFGQPAQGHTSADGPKTSPRSVHLAMKVVASVVYRRARGASSGLS